MDFQKLTIKAQEAFSAAQGTAVSRGNPELTPDHLLLALLDQQGGVAPRQLEKAGQSPSETRAQVAQRVEALPRIEGARQQPAASPATRKVLEQAFSEAEARQDEHLAVEHRLLALAGAADVDRGVLPR